MKVATVHLEGSSPYSQSKPHQTDKLKDESADNYEKRTWREKAHANGDGKLFIPPMALKNCLAEAALFKSMKKAGKGQATWTKHFLAGILVTDPILLPLTKESVPGEWVYCNADGKKGSGTRVFRCFPLIHKWEGNAIFQVLDDEITEDIFRYMLTEAGKFIGIGRFRPRNGGFYGRFGIGKFSWEEVG